jgi:hypothetical protein
MTMMAPIDMGGGQAAWQPAVSTPISFQYHCPTSVPFWDCAALKSELGLSLCSGFRPRSVSGGDSWGAAFLCADSAPKYIY